MSAFTQIIKVHLANGSTREIRVDSTTTVQRVLNVVLGGLGMDRLSFGHFALRLCGFPDGSADVDSRWLHPNLRIPEVVQYYALSETLQMRFELRLRFIPHGLREMYQTQTAAFLYLYEQLVGDYVRHVSWKIERHKAIQLAALAIRKRFYAIGEGKHFDFIELERDGGFLRYLPESVVVGVKKKQLEKWVTEAVNKIALLSELECVFKFIKHLITLARFDTEVFRVCFGNDWEKPVELHIGAHHGIAYKSENTKDPVPLVDLRNIVCITTVRKGHSRSEKCLVKVKVSGSSVPVIISTLSFALAESLAHLLDGYQMLLSQQPSVWEFNSNDISDLNVCLDFQKGGKNIAYDLIGFGADEDISLIIDSLTVDPQNVKLEELLGSGHYGNVYFGKYRGGDVAIKVGKSADQVETDNVLLKEAVVMSKLAHPNLITLLGICVCEESTMWLIIELAPLGELRTYLQNNRNSISTASRLGFSKQISAAVRHLHSLRIIHRDIAARNGLVVNEDLVKLSDFGMSKFLNDSDFLSSESKLPLKWLPVESLERREFSIQSDVYMLGVCIWEILTGEKPWSETPNREVINRLRRGDVLPKPPQCPDFLYEILKSVWALEPQQRPNTEIINNLLNENIVSPEMTKALDSPFRLAILDVLQSVVDFDYAFSNSLPNEKFVFCIEKIIFLLEQMLSMEFEMETAEIDFIRTQLRSAAKEMKEAMTAALDDIETDFNRLETQRLSRSIAAHCQHYLRAIQQFIPTN